MGTHHTDPQPRRKLPGGHGELHSVLLLAIPETKMLQKESPGRSRSLASNGKADIDFRHSGPFYKAGEKLGLGLTSSAVW